MKMLFGMDEQVHHFKVTGEIIPDDLVVLKQSLFQFFDSHPAFTILDLSEITLQVPDFELQNALTKISTMAQAKGLHLSVAQTDIEAKLAKQTVLEMALIKELDVLRAKVELREKISNDLKEIIEQNQTLKETINQKLDAAKNKNAGVLNPFIEKLWSER